MNEAQNYISVAGGIELRDKIEIKYLQRNKNEVKFFFSFLWFYILLYTYECWKEEMYTKFNLVFEMVNIFACIVVRLFLHGVGGDLI